MTLWQSLLTALGVYLAFGAASVWAAYGDMTTEKWWGWLVVVVAWPIFWWKVIRA